MLIQSIYTLAYDADERSGDLSVSVSVYNSVIQSIYILAYDADERSGDLYEERAECRCRCEADQVTQALGTCLTQLP